MVEHRFRKAGVVGSNPIPGSNPRADDRSADDPSRARGHGRGRRAVRSTPIRRFFRSALRVLSGPFDRRTVVRLARAAAARAAAIGRALVRFIERDLGESRAPLAAIEAERARLLSCHDPLVDGSLGDGGPFDADATVQSACTRSKKRKHAELIHLIVRELAPRAALELGTNVGISGAYQATALALAGPRGRLVTIEASPYRARVARALHATLGLSNVEQRVGRIEDLLDGVLAEPGGFDFAFVDGLHTHDATIQAFEKITRAAPAGAAILFDDVRWSDAMERAWSEIAEDARVHIVVDFGGMGLCVTDRGAHSGAKSRTRLRSIV